ncbi:FliI/YscN family ATPase [Altererythrobacter lutimaris]|uniref:Flagellum-specific ATP synthase n=1 Tax=Altererythrobacter lutimaris TaxID=2743979 RepID=A0A850H6B7_9SPHN|nr:FliI/YscN family ATPase [Altererythrobacter lutimaris]NVE93319.1 FliI/YscN family ATPase [Altererythrobacter lutimaris]
MIATLQKELEAMASRGVDPAPVRVGRVVACDGGLVEVSGLPAPIGTLCRIETQDKPRGCTAEVIGFRAGHSLMMLLGDTVMLQPGADVRADRDPGMVHVGEALLGRAVDGSMRPIDGGERPDVSELWPLGGIRESALERSSVVEPFDCGVRAINGLATMGVGQRLGIMAGSGVGKSVLIDMIAHGAEADITIVGLIGERAREVSDFVSRHMSGAQRNRTIMVAVPADHAPNLRLRGAQYACALAEYFRSQGKRVLLILDSLTRVAHAAREIALLLGEPGAARGYPPSALATITRLVERAGNSARSGGAITGVYTVLADGDDQDDPVVDTARAILDGHIVLSRELAQQGHYPAIDVSASLSRVMDAIVSEQHRRDARELRSLVSAVQTNRDLVMMGAYRPGSDPLLDRGMAAMPKINTFLQQDADERVTIADSVAALANATRLEAEA